jgi:phosphomethylpyrimidine synthase
MNFGSMKITHDVREFATKKGVAEEKALAVGMAEKAKEFVDKGSEIYHGKPEGVDDHH